MVKGLINPSTEFNATTGLRQILEKKISPLPLELFPFLLIQRENGYGFFSDLEILNTVEIVTLVDYHVFDKWSNSPSLKRGDEYKALKERIGEGLVRASERYILNLSGHLDCVEYATPLTNEYWVNAVKGGCLGPEQTPDQVGLGRFSSFNAGIEGLFLVGTGTIGGGIMPCVASGVLAGAKAASLLGLKL
jgi:all-trans-retinol 13,14-reductase